MAKHRLFGLLSSMALAYGCQSAELPSEFGTVEQAAIAPPCFGSCGGPSWTGACSCAPDCVSGGNPGTGGVDHCCASYQAECGSLPGSCGYASGDITCGGLGRLPDGSPAECSCHVTCETFGNCCEDYVNACAPPHGCCAPSINEGCWDGAVGFAIQDCVCAAMPDCCFVRWDDSCVAAVESLGCGECGSAGSECCGTASTPGCGEPVVEACVCSADPYCCATAWDSLCVSEVESLGCAACDEPEPSTGACCETASGPGCGDTSVEACVCASDPYCCATRWDSLCVSEVESLGCGVCSEPDPPTGPCCEIGSGPGCSDASVEACVCATDPYCCVTFWDSLCVQEVESLACGSCSAPNPCTPTSPDNPVYVDPANGVDDLVHGAGPGSCAFRTIQFALDHAAGTINLMAGTHVVSGEPLDVDGQELVCDPSASVTISGQPLGGTSHKVMILRAGSTVRNCRIVGNDMIPGYCIEMLSGGNIRLENNTIDACGGAAVSAFGANLTISGNTFLHDGINVAFVASGSATMVGNVFNGTIDDVHCNVATTIVGNSNTDPGGVVTCSAACGCPAGF